MDESWLISVSHGRMAEDRSTGWAVGATLQIFGDSEVDQTAQGVRFAGDFEDYYLVFVGATLRF